MQTATWIGIGLLLPFWWGLALTALALLGDASPAWRARVSRLFDRLDGLEDPMNAAVS